MIYNTTAYQLEPAASDADAVLDAAQVTFASLPLLLFYILDMISVWYWICHWLVGSGCLSCDPSQLLVKIISILARHRPSWHFQLIGWTLKPKIQTDFFFSGPVLRHIGKLVEMMFKTHSFSSRIWKGLFSNAFTLLSLASTTFRNKLYHNSLTIIWASSLPKAEKKFQDRRPYIKTGPVPACHQDFIISFSW